MYHTGRTGTCKPNTSPEVPTTPPPPAAFTQLRSLVAGDVGVRLQTTGKLSTVRKTIVREGLVRVRCFPNFYSTAERASRGIISWCIYATVRSHPNVASPQHPLKYKGALDVVRKLYVESGVRSVFRGSLSTLAREGPGSAAYFATYEIDLISGAIMTAGSVHVGIDLPVDTVKSILQSGDGKLKHVLRPQFTDGGILATFLGVELAYKAMGKVF
ncbi:hypothetical protein L211DRAFT_861584 [Terfezia boudieri ATCC MYA-4762]|uniref:Mitochondrial carrier n=1 Tax=Terfezia boudieri ATCC MYA-4762 TaxID=1051890 RepID=A0A3N4LQ80_9PEZI|nr:hypothetical protein L211DRAFT_861584 [Terfezia boudieri ATCC MYA-4762]